MRKSENIFAFQDYLLVKLFIFFEKICKHKEGSRGKDGKKNVLQQRKKKVLNPLPSLNEAIFRKKRFDEELLNLLPFG